MTSGAKVVAVLLACVLAVAVFIAGAFVFFEPETAPCASGDLATNALIDGSFENRTETFETVEEAEAFICHDVPELHAEGLTLEAISAERNVPLEVLVDGQGLGIVRLEYVQEGTGQAIMLNAAPYPVGRPPYFEDQLPAGASTEPVRFDGIGAAANHLGTDPGAVSITWQDGTLEHEASAHLDESFTLDDLLGLLETLD